MNYIEIMNQLTSFQDQVVLAVRYDAIIKLTYLLMLFTIVNTLTCKYAVKVVTIWNSPASEHTSSDCLAAMLGFVLVIAFVIVNVAAVPLTPQLVTTIVKTYTSPKAVTVDYVSDKIEYILR